MFGVLLLTVAIALIAYRLYKLVTNNARYFEERNLKYKSGFGAVMNLFSVSSGKMDMFELAKQSYDQFPDEP